MATYDASSFVQRLLLTTAGLLELGLRAARGAGPGRSGLCQCTRLPNSCSLYSRDLVCPWLLRAISSVVPLPPSHLVPPSCAPSLRA
eukprot:5166568-Pyramimonas_sp.AAC.1